MKEIVFEITAGGNRMTDTNEKNRDTTQKKQNTDTAMQEEHTAEPRIGEMPRRNHKDEPFCIIAILPEPSFNFFTPLSINNICPSEIAGTPGPKRPS